MRVGLAKLYFVNGEVERSRKLLEQELVELRLKHGADSPEAIAQTEQLAQAGLSFGVQEFALEHYADVLKRLENKHGAGAEEPLKLRGKIASQWYDLKKLDKAQESYAELVPTMKTQLGAGHPLTLATTANWAMTLEDLGKFADAEPIRRTVAEDTAQAGKDPDSPEVLTARALVGANLLRQSKWTKAETILAAVLEARRKNEPMAWTTYNAASLLGEALLQQKKYQEAEPLLLEGYQGIQKNMRQIPPASYSRYYDAIRRLVTLYDQTDRNPEADKLRNSLPRGLRPSP